MGMLMEGLRIGLKPVDRNWKLDCRLDCRVAALLKSQSG